MLIIHMYAINERRHKAYHANDDETAINLSVLIILIVVLVVLM